MRRGSILLVVVASAACRKETINKPVPPDMSDVLRSLDAPAGTFDAETAGAVKATATDAVNGVIGSGLPQRLLEEAKAIAQKSQRDGAEGSTRTQAIRPAAFEGEGFGRVTRICDGWSSQPTPDAAANGSLSMTITFSELTVDPVVWGNADRCKLLLGTRRVQLDRVAPDGPPNVGIHLGGALAPADIGTLPVVIALAAHAQIDDLEIGGTFAVRLSPGAQTLELAVPVTDGNVVVTVGGKELVGVRDKNGTFGCDASGCRGSSGEIVPW